MLQNNFVDDKIEEKRTIVSLIKQPELWSALTAVGTAEPAAAAQQAAEVILEALKLVFKLHAERYLVTSFHFRMEILLEANSQTSALIDTALQSYSARASLQISCPSYHQTQYCAT